MWMVCVVYGLLADMLLALLVIVNARLRIYILWIYLYILYGVCIYSTLVMQIARLWALQRTIFSSGVGCCYFWIDLGVMISVSASSSVRIGISDGIIIVKNSCFVCHYQSLW